MAGLDNTGFTRPTLAELKKDCDADLALALGPSVNLLPASVIGTVEGIVVGRMDLIWTQIENVRNCLYPRLATGVNLDNAISLNFLKRLPASNSRQIGQIYFGSVGAVLPAGTVLRVNGNPLSRFIVDTTLTLIAGTNEVQSITFGSAPTSGTFTLTFESQTTTAIAYNATAATVQAALNALSSLSGVVVSGSVGAGFTVTYAGLDGLQPQPLLVVGSNSLLNVSAVAVAVTVLEVTAGVAQATGTLTCATKGPVVAPAGTLTVFENTVSGITSTVNTTDATPGENLETDAALKIRRESSYQAASSATFEAIRSRLLEVTNVTAAIVIQNLLDTVDGSGRPPHSFEAVVQGGLSTDVAKAIWLNQPLGIPSYGNTSATYTDSQGFVRTIPFSRPTVVPIYITATLSVNSLFSSGSTTTALSALEAYINSLGIGQEVIVSPTMIAALSSIPGIVGVALLVGIAPTPTLSNNIPITNTQVAQTQNSYIVVNTVPGT